MVEWFFLMAVMSGPFTPNDGWQHVERTRHTYATMAECETARHRIIIKYREHPIEGGGIVITGCQPIHVDKGGRQ